MILWPPLFTEKVMMLRHIPRKEERLTKQHVYPLVRPEEILREISAVVIKKLFILPREANILW